MAIFKGQTWPDGLWTLDLNFWLGVQSLEQQKAPFIAAQQPLLPIILYLWSRSYFYSYIILYNNVYLKKMFVPYVILYKNVSIFILFLY